MKTTTVVFLGLLATLGPSAGATVTVERSPTTGTTATVTYDVPTDKWTVVCGTTRADTPATFYVKSDAFDKIASITINVDAPQLAHVYIGDLNSVTKIRSADVIQKGTGVGAFLLRGLQTVDDVGHLKPNSIVSGFVGGSITDELTLLPTTAILESTIQFLEVAGNITSDIQVQSGGIRELAVTGNIGAAGQYIAIGVRDHIRRLSTANIYANIDANTAASTYVCEFNTTGGGFHGRLNARTLQSDPGQGFAQVFGIAGDLDADITLTNEITDYNDSQPEVQIGGRFTAGHTVSIATRLRTNALFSIGASDGLQGQILINAGGAALPPEMWLGDVRVGGTTLSLKPYYGQTSAALGGGAVGRAPFRYHGGDCSPVNGAVIYGNLSQAVMRHYGPVKADGGTPGGKTVVIESRVVKPPSPVWTDVTSGFTVSTPGGGSRDVTITPTSGVFPVNREYRISPVGTNPPTGFQSLVCDQTTGLPPVYRDTIDPYSFEIPLGMGRLMAMDQDADGVVTWADAAAWKDSPVDLDGDGKADDTDWDALVAVIEEGGKY